MHEKTNFHASITRKKSQNANQVDHERLGSPSAAAFPRSATRVLKTAFHIPDDLQSVVRLGRTVSALFAVGSIVCLGLAVYLICNRAAAALLSFLLAYVWHQFYDLAHTMSDGAALMFGSSLTLLAIVLLEQRASVARALFLGFSVAIAASAKYVGALLLIPAFIAVLRSGGKEFRINRIVEFCLGLLFAILVINFFAVADLQRAAVDLVQDLALAFGSTPYGVQSLIAGTYWLYLQHNTTGDLGDAGYSLPFSSSRRKTD